MGPKDPDPDPDPDARVGSRRGHGMFQDTVAGFMVWLVMLPFLPLAAYEQWKRRRARHTPEGRAKERAVNELMAKLKETIRRSERENKGDQQGPG